MNFRHGPKISYLTNNENYQHIRRIDSRSCAPSRGEVNGSTSWCPIGRISPIRPMPPNAKAPFSIFFAKYMRHLRYISIIISVRYNLTDRTVPLVCNFYGGWRNVKLLSSGECRKIRDCCIFRVNDCEVFL